MESTLISFKELVRSKRWDFDYFSPEFKSVIQKIQQSGWDVKYLKDIIIDLTDGQHGYLKHVSEGVPLLRTTNLFEDDIRFDDVRYIAPEVHANIKRSQLKSGDVLLATIGVTLGTAAVFYDEIGEANINQNLVKITPKPEINSLYLSLFLNSRPGRLQTKTSASKSVVPIISYSRLNKLLVPVPPRSLQDQIAQVMQEAYGDRQKKLEKAGSLINGIDDEIKDFLEVVIGEIPDEPRFVMKILDLEDRWDFKVYDKRYVTVVNATEKGKYPVLRLGSLCRENPKRGSQPKYNPDGIIPVLKTVNVGSGHIDFDSALRVDSDFLEIQSGKKSKIYKGDILITSTGDGSWGRASVFEEEFDCVVDGHISIVRLKPEHNPHFLAEFLNSSLGQAQFWQRYRGATGQTEIYPDDISALKIATPPKEIQDKIAQKVQQRRSEAKRLRSQAEAIVTAAKARVERMILGEETVE